MTTKVKTKLFNVRLTLEKHKKFQKYADKKGVSMSFLINSYIDSLLDETTAVPVGMEKPKEERKVKWEDPLAAIRNQYKPGRDF